VNPRTEEKRDTLKIMEIALKGNGDIVRGRAQPDQKNRDASKTARTVQGKSGRKSPGSKLGGHPWGGPVKESLKQENLGNNVHLNRKGPNEGEDVQVKRGGQEGGRRASHTRNEGHQKREEQFFSGLFSQGSPTEGGRYERGKRLYNIDQNRRISWISKENYRM